MTETRAILTQMYAAFNGRHVEGALAAMTPDVSWPKASEGGTVVGPDEVRAYWTRQWSEFDPHVEPIGFAEVDNGRVQVRVHQVVRSLSGDLLSDSEVTHVFTLKDGLVAAMALGDVADGPSAAFTRYS